MDKIETIDLSKKAPVVEYSEEEAIALEESSLEAIVTCWLKQITRGPIALAIENEGRQYGYELPLNSSEYVARRIWGGISDGHYREVFLSIVRMFVNANKGLVKKMLDGEFKTRWDYMGGK